MNMRICVLLLATALIQAGLASQVFADDPPKFELKEGDRVVLLGGTFIEREGTEGYLETLLTSETGHANVTFRNLGWSGDTVFGLARARFGKQADGFQHLKEHVEALKPTVLIVSYGQNESFDGEAGLPEFKRGLDQLLKVLDGTKARVVFVSPIRHEDLGRPLPDPAKHNTDLYLYVDLLKKVAAERKDPFVDLFRDLAGPRPLTDNGIHLTSAGYWQAAQVTVQSLRAARKPMVLKLDAGSAPRVTSSEGGKVERLEAKPGRLAFQARADSLPAPRLPKPSTTSSVKHVDASSMEVNGLPDGRYDVKVDGKKVAAFRSESGMLRIKLDSGPDFDQAEALRHLINSKNELYFHRWRPENETYLFGFRKYEQGQNAREIPLFDPLVTAKEGQIAELRVPKPHSYEIVTSSEEPSR